MKSRRNYILDAVCQSVGFSNTITLMRWCGGSNLYIPAKADDGHFLRKLIGPVAFQSLVRDMGCQTIWVPAEPLAQYKPADDKQRDVARRLAAGASIKDAAAATGLSVRQVQRIRQAMADTYGLPSLDAPEPAQKLERDGFGPGEGSSGGVGGQPIV